MRSLTSGALTALASAQVPIVMLIDMAFAPALRLASSNVNIDWGGNTYLATGPLGSVEAIKDSSGDASTLSFSISGVPSENISLALSQSARNKACTVRLAILNPTTHAIEDVSTIGTFMLDQLTVAGSTIAVTAKPMSAVFSRPKPNRYTDGDQQRVSAGDRALEYLVSQSAHQDVWPAASWGKQ